MRKAVKADRFLDGNPLHVEPFYPFMGTVFPVDEPRNLKSTGLPEFRHPVDLDRMEFIMDSNQERKLKDDLHELEKAQITWIRGQTHIQIRYADVKVDKEFEERPWQERCRKVVDSFLESCASEEFPLDEEILAEVANQLPQIQRQVLSIFTAKVKLMKTSQTLKMICLKSNIREFADKLNGRLKKIEREEREKKLEEKKKTDIPSEILQLLQNAKIEKILQEKFESEDVRALVQLDKGALVLKTPKGLMEGVHRYLRQRLEEIDKCAIDSPAEIREILKRAPGKKKMAKELPKGCSFNVDDKNKRVIFLGRILSETEEGSEKAKNVLVSDQTLKLTSQVNSLLKSYKWDDFRKTCEQRYKIRLTRKLKCIAVFGFKENVSEAIKKIRDFLNETRATAGEFPLDSPLLQKFFGEFYKEEIQALEQKLEHFGVKISFNENRDLIRFSGGEEGLKQVEERLYVMKEEIKEETFEIKTPGMKKFLNQEEGNRLIEKIQRQKKCIIEVTERSEELGEKEEYDDESESDDGSSTCDDEEDTDEDEYTISTPEGKRVTWKTGEIQKEKADVLVCSVGSDLRLSHGAIATAMSRAAGPELQEALRKAAKGRHYSYPPGKLTCRYVIHCVCCPWNDETDEQKQILKALLLNCFDRASELGACSIGLPLVGTGTLGFPHVVAVHIMVEAAVEHSQDNPESPLEEIRFVVFNDDQKGITSFEEKFTEFKKVHQPIPKRRKENTSKKNPVPAFMSGFKCKDVNFGQLRIKVVKGDITEESTDAICNVITPELDMKSGNLSRSIANICGDIVQEELLAHSGPQHQGIILMTSAGSVPAMKKILHIVVGSGNKQHLQSCVEKALNKADAERLQSLSIPAVGSGGLGLSAEDSAEVVFAAIRAFTAKPCTSIREIKIVVFNDSVVGAFVNELELMKKETSPPENCNENEMETLARYCGELEDCTHEATTCSLPQNVVIHGRKQSLDEAMSALEDEVKKELFHVRDKVVGGLPKRCLRRLKRMSNNLDVKLEQPEPSCIRLQGLQKDVMTVRLEVNSIIREQLEEDKADQVFRTVRWNMISISGKEEPFDKIANLEIELAYKDKKPSLTFTHKNQKAEINFAINEITILKNGKKKRIRRRDVFPLPDEWDRQPRDENGKEETVYLASLDEESKEYKRVQEKFFKSLHETRVNIIKIERIQNPSLYFPYVMKKQSMDARNGSLENERELFHGTDYNRVKSINMQGFNRSFCGRNGSAYGDGVYFAEDASYSTSFSRESPHGESFMYLAKVLVGEYTRGEKGMRTPPSIDSVSHPEILFDSVVNSTEEPTVFVIFADCHVYPEYLITFKETPI
ncbi:Protein mono-ADP-ribosyltransferase PARP14 [Acropora cervicornis]|uniref:Poly [ADP-ribose] polymerase n=1 Tax=Acropora cervicornis TaxID=6130 RepID=A0AAD9V455_ACRCE|nr:Protein mono-ADP-ribosyltransferase PARP14 [Acropora cervicornis]